MRISSSRPYRPVPTPSPVRLMNPLCSARAPRASSGRDDWPLGGGNNHFGVQHAMDRAAFGDVQEPGTLVGGQPMGAGGDALAVGARAGLGHDHCIMAASFVEWKRWR